jgi:hypothetical protein
MTSASSSGSLASHSQFQLLVAVHAEHANGRSSDVRPANDDDDLPMKMIIPALLARVIEQGNHIRKGIDAG